MATLTVPITYSDGVLLSASDLDAIVDSIETLLNTTGLNDDNIQANSITGYSKFKTATVTTAKIASGAVTTSRFAASSITTAKILDDNITTTVIKNDTIEATKLDDSVGVATVGSVLMFYTFGGELSVSRGWMICNGDTISITNYDLQHTDGAAVADGLSSSDLINLKLPGMVDSYAVGAVTTPETGVTTISTEGLTGNILDVSHTHTTTGHTHTSQSAWYYSVGGANNFWTRPTPNTTDEQSTYTTTGITWDGNSNASTTLETRPESIEFIYIMKVV